ncbi:hypothetical protein NQ314_011837 [Rhamnusium bicolor]|uniref:Vacuolar protein sorting-associated protein 13A n=1 Tax=Rhamnusium bicolor TaxID=1586634 RepID=A0AAV8XG14_9CUCU|nr:hypothetical protein NQ314_011837 [Rhamnusium bicolor]
MVFEKTLSSVLNRFLGDYVENLNGHQLNVGIWGGDVELKYLALKPSALNELDLPIQTISGTIETLILKIPWKSLYTSPTVICVEDIYLLAAPNQEVKYDPIKEEKRIIEAKQKAIQKFEEIKKAEAEKDKPKADATFVEKLITTIIKNVQLEIKRIHIRYEDKITNPEAPFAFGITLNELAVESTDSTWKKGKDDDLSKIYKVVRLEGLSVYWNCDSEVFGYLHPGAMTYHMSKCIATKDGTPENYSYILGPINASARLRMSPKPENDTPAFSIPKIHLNLDMEKLFIGISKAQYRDIVALADSLDRMAKATPYRKFRPQVDTYRGHFKEWWHFAYESVLSDIRRKREGWQWGHMLSYRKTCEEYKDLYKKKLKNSLSAPDKERIDVCEKALDITNIVIIRQRIEMEIERMKMETTSEKKSWFGWMWGGSSKDDLAGKQKAAAILKELQDEVTPEEKAKLYKAIDYQENVGPAVYPEDYIDNSITFLLRTLEVELRDDDSETPTVLLTELKTVRVKLETRPAGSALKLHVKVDDLMTQGMNQDNFIPKIITSETDNKQLGLLEVAFEINPLDRKCDQRLKIIAQPIKVVYDAKTINKAIEIFKLPADTSLDQIQAAADSGIMNVKEMTSTGLQFAIEKHVRLDLNIDLQAPYIIVPYGGKFTGNENVMVANLGRLKIYSFGEHSTPADVRNLYEQGIAHHDILKVMKEHSYEHFKLELTDLQILVAQSDEDWRTTVKESITSDMHLLNPLSLTITYSKCLIVDDPGLTHHKFKGALPSIDVNISDARLILLVSLATSIPLPTGNDPPPLQPLVRSKGSSLMLLKYKELQESAKLTKKSLPPLPADSDRSGSEFIQMTILEATFEMSELSLTLNQQATLNSAISELASCKVKGLEFKLKQQTFNTNVSLLLGSISLQQNREGTAYDIISTPIANSGEEYLFKVQFNQVDIKSPELHSVYKSCESSLLLDFGVLNIILHQEGLLSLIRYGTNIQNDITQLLEDTPHDRVATTRTGRQLSVISEHLSDIQRVVTKPTKRKKVPLIVETIKFKLKADLQEVSVMFTTDKSNISSCAIRGINTDIIVKHTYTQINAKLIDIAVTDLNPESLHRLILSGTEGVALTAQIVLNNLEIESDKSDMDVTITMGGMRIVFLNWFLMNMLQFLDQFQMAQKKIIEASQAAAQSAKDNMKHAYEKATKISLNVNIKAPDIIVPVSSKSYEALFLDLGVITLCNRFLTLEQKSEEGFSAVVDDLKVSLTDLKIARIKLDSSYKIIRECLLVEPINLEIALKRNLSSSWYTAIPDIDISGKIKTIELLLSQADFQMILSVLSGNLAEGQHSKAKIDKSVSTTDTADDIAIVGIEFTEIPEKTKQVHIFLNFTFTMEHLIINLYTGGLKSLTEETACHDPNTHLGRFSLEGLALKGRILTDDSIVMSVILVNCLLDDMRKGREDMINRLIERSQDSEASSTDIRIYSFTMILSVDYLLKLADFFNTSNQSLEQSKQTQVTTTGISTTKSSRGVVPGPTASKDKETQITVNLKLEKPDIILVEHMDNINTNAMLMNSEILVKFRMAGKHQVINGAIKDLQVYTCTYNPAHRSDTRANILYPVTISLAGSTPQDKGLHVELLVNNIRLSVSPATIELLNRILLTMSSSGTSEDASTKEQFNFENIWKQKPFLDPDYWFLNTEFATEALEGVVPGRTAPQRPLQELCIISMPSIIVTVEAGVGNKTLPMLTLDTSFKGSARNWSSQLSVEASLTMQMGYYNSRLALWEPLIEPVEIVNDSGNRFIPWELKFELSMNEQEEAAAAMSPTSDSEGDSQAQPVMSIDITSENNLEITITKTCLEVLDNLGKAFALAMKSESISSITTLEASYKVLNEIGEDITLMLEQSSFKIADGGSLEDINKSAAVPLQLKSDVVVVHKTVQLGKELLANSLKQDLFLHVKVNSKNCDLALPVVRANKRFFMLNYRGVGHDNWGIISDVKVDGGVTIITLRTILQVYNHFQIPVDVYYMTSRGNELELIGTVQPNGIINLPLKAVYSPTCELFFTVSGYSVTCTPYVWKDLLTNLTITKLLQCPQKASDKAKGPFVMKVVGEIEQVYFENTSRHTMASACYNIHLRPAVIFKNSLPLDIICCVDELAEEFTVQAGETLQLPNVDPGKNVLVIRLPEYLEKEWSCRNNILEDPEEFSVWTFNSYDSPTKMSLNLGMHIVDNHGSLLMTLYCPFWMLNKTGLMIGYRQKLEGKNQAVKCLIFIFLRLEFRRFYERSTPPAPFQRPHSLFFQLEEFLRQKKASIRVESGEWSDKFSMDAAGSAGMVTCKANDRIYQIGIHNQLTYNNLTKQVTFMPYYVIINNAPFPIECQENDRPADHWTKVEPESCSALWPRSELEDKLLKIRVNETEEVSAPFLYTESHTTLLRLNNKYGGISVDIQLTEGAVYINLAPYEHGSAPALLVNHTDCIITFWEKDSIQKRSLLPKNSILYTWENPSGPRMVAWDKGKHAEILSDLRKDDFGEFKPTDDEEIFWVTFLDGMQRVLLFTQDKAVAQGAQACTLFELIQQDITVSIHGLGLSLVNNLTRQEVMYIGIASSGVIWEVCRMNGRRFKQLGTKESTHIEAAYQQFLLRQNDIDSDEDTSHFIIDGKTTIDFKLGIMTKPQKRKIRRTFQTGLWLQMKNSPNQMQFHAKVNRLQIDNQMFDCIFPVVLAPISPPKSVAADSGIKPFMEVSIVQLLMKNSQVRQFKYFKVLVQEFHIKVDLGFINAIVNLLEQTAVTEEDEKQLFLTDMKLVDEALYAHVSSQSIQEQKSFYDLLHFSPLKIHISFSMAAGSSAGPNPSTPNFLTVLLQGIGVTLTDLNDIVFKLAYFERDYTFLTQKQLISEATSHYVGQSIKQLYVLVLGLDVIGNPYGLVVGISKGVEDLFYEPFQGAIQGPDEFAEGLALGVKSLFGHTVGGAAGAVSRITGAMGKGIAALTFDEDYQRKRRDQLKKKPASAQEGMARSGKGLVMGVYSGVTGVFTKPVTGAREQGVEGFFKGLGKGAVGLVTRPVAGVVDFASGSLDVVKRAAECGEDTGKLRPPRFLQADGLVRPYNFHEAEGHKLLTELHKGKYAATDIYAAHYVVIQKKEVLLLTNKRIGYICHNDLFGGWQVEWSYTWEELPQPSRVVPKGVLITTSEKKKKFFGSSDTTKTILIGDAAIREEICLKIESLRGS